MIQMLKNHQWSGVFGFALFVGMMGAGYFYNLTFVQLGLEDLGARKLGLSAASVARHMAILAILTCLTALAFGYWMQQRGWGQNFRLKLRWAFGVVLIQTLLTIISIWVNSEFTFLAWLAGASLALGIGVPVMFSMTVHLVPVRSRGTAAALVTAGSYFAAATFSSEWSFEAFRYQALNLMPIGTIGMGVLAWLRHPWLEQIARQHTRPEFAIGRFVKRDAEHPQVINRRLLGLILIMFGVYFVDSLGFLRLLKAPLYMQSAWQSPELNTRLFIAMVHIVGALIAGVLYSALNQRSLFYWIFGLFALTHLQYSFHIRTESATGVLMMPMLYALAVSLYTVVNFALWADLSTPQTISFNASLGVALSAWTATFLSTALAIHWQETISLERHIQIVDSLAILFFLGMLGLAFFRSPRRKLCEV
jgi:MFS family permease